MSLEKFNKSLLLIRIFCHQLEQAVLSIKYTNHSLKVISLSYETYDKIF